MFFSTSTVVATLLFALYAQAAPTNLVARKPRSGDGTAYIPSLGYGSCGVLSSDSDMVIAVGHDIFDTYPGAGSLPNLNPICGKKITATNPANGASVDVKVVDRCQECLINDLDFSPGAFASLFDGATTGKFAITWEWAA